MRLFIAGLLIWSAVLVADVNQELRVAVSSADFIEKKLQAFFDDEGMSPLRLSYEQCIADKALGKPQRSCWTLVALLAYKKALSNDQARILYHWLTKAQRYLPSESFVEDFADALTEI